MSTPDTCRCYLCGTRFPEEQAVRRKVKTGEVSGLAGTLDFDVTSWFSAGFRSLQDVCPACSAKLDRRNRLEWIAVAVVCVLGLTLAAFFHFRH